MKAAKWGQDAVIDRDKLERFKTKDYRDSYMSGRVRGSIALQIRQLREDENLLQSAFAKKIGTWQSVISRLEDTEYGRVRVQTLIDIACAMEVALVVKFVSYDDFFAQLGDITPASLHAETFPKTYKKHTAAIQAPVISSGLQLQIAGARDLPQMDVASLAVPRLPSTKLIDALSGDLPSPLRENRVA